MIRAAPRRATWSTMDTRRVRRSRKRSPRRSPEPARRATTEIVINALNATKPLRLRVDERLQEEAWRWNYALRNRRRWASRGEAARQQREEVHELVKALGL